jgi:hypothetical protein
MPEVFLALALIRPRGNWSFRFAAVYVQGLLFSYCPPETAGRLHSSRRRLPSMTGLAPLPRHRDGDPGAGQPPQNPMTAAL